MTLSCKDIRIRCKKIRIGGKDLIPLPYLFDVPSRSTLPYLFNVPIRSTYLMFRAAVLCFAPDESHLFSKIPSPPIYLSPHLPGS